VSYSPKKAESESSAVCLQTLLALVVHFAASRVFVNKLSQRSLDRILKGRYLLLARSHGAPTRP